MAFAEKVGQIRLTRTAERRLRRAELIRSYTNDFYLSRDVVELFMDIDHERFNYDSTFLGSDRELALIHLLDNFNALGHSWRRHVISLNDLLPTTLAYAALRTWENPSVRRYLSQIQIWDENRYWPGWGSATSRTSPSRYGSCATGSLASSERMIPPSAHISDGRSRWRCCCGSPGCTESGGWASPR